MNPKLIVNKLDKVIKNGFIINVVRGFYSRAGSTRKYGNFNGFLIISTAYLVMHSLFSTREKFWNFQAHLQKMEIPHGGFILRTLSNSLLFSFVMMTTQRVWNPPISSKIYYVSHLVLVLCTNMDVMLRKIIIRTLIKLVPSGYKNSMNTPSYLSSIYWS